MKLYFLYINMVVHIKQLIKRVQADASDWKLDLLKSWPEIVGNLNTHITLEKINDDSLVLGVIDSCWMQELYLLSPFLCTLINQKLDIARIKKIRFKQVGNPTQKNRPKEQAHTVTPQKKRALSAQEEGALTNIKDSELQEALKSFLQRCQQ